MRIFRNVWVCGELRDIDGHSLHVLVLLRHFLEFSHTPRLLSLVWVEFRYTYLYFIFGDSVSFLTSRPGLQLLYLGVVDGVSDLIEIIAPLTLEMTSFGGALGLRRDERQWGWNLISTMQELWSFQVSAFLYIASESSLLLLFIGQYCSLSVAVDEMIWESVILLCGHCFQHYWTVVHERRLVSITDEAVLQRALLQWAVR